MKFNKTLILHISRSCTTIVRYEIPMYTHVSLYTIIPHNIVYYYVTSYSILTLLLYSFNNSYHSFIQKNFRHVHTLKHHQSSFNITWFHVYTLLVMLSYISDITTYHPFICHSSQESFWYHQYILYHLHTFSVICTLLVCHLSMLPL